MVDKLMYAIGNGRQTCLHALCVCMYVCVSVAIGERAEVSAGTSQTRAEVKGGSQPQTPRAADQDGVTAEQRDRGERERRAEEERVRDCTHWTNCLLPAPGGDAD